MGIRLVGATLAPHWAQTLSHPARTILTHMAYTARDTSTPSQPAAVYWGGRDALLIALYGDDFTNDPQRRDNAIRQLRRTLAELKAAGAIEILQAANGHTRTSYKLTPDSWITIPTDIAERLANRTPNNTSQRKAQ